MSCRMIKVSGLALLAALISMTGRLQSSYAQYMPASPGEQQQQSGSPSPSGQLPGSGQGPSGQLPGAGGPALPQANPEEDKDYKAFYDARTGDPQKQAQLGEDFLKKYPTSRYLGTVYAAIAGDYLQLGDEDKMFAAAQKSIDNDPDNVDALSLMVWAGARRINPNAPDAADKFAKLENYGHHAITVLASLQKPATVDDATFNAAKSDKLSMVHSGLGLMDFERQRFPDAITELTQAVQLANNPDQVDYYILGRADEYSNHLDDAIAAFGKCADQPGSVQANCKAGIDETKKRALDQPAPSH